MSLRIALAQWRVGDVGSLDAFAGRVAHALASAAADGAAVAVLPEYLALDLAGMFADDVRTDFARSLDALQPLHQDWLALFRAQACEHGLHVVAGTYLLRMPNGAYRNRAYLFDPEGRCAWQDKLTLTGFERAAGVIEAGDELRVFETALGRVALNVCYDVEFPHYARAQAEAGARLVLVPSCTDTPAGATRVRVGGMARALENQVYVAQAVTAGAAAWSPALDTNTGRAGVWCPSDRGLPEDGVVAAGAADAEWLIAEVDFAQLDEVRRSGQVANAADWTLQLRPGVVRARVERL